MITQEKMPWSIIKFFKEMYGDQNLYVDTGA